MDRLNNAIDTLVDETCSGLSKPKFVRAAAKSSGLKLAREDANEIVTKLITVFRARCLKEIDELVQDTKIEQKLSELKILSEKCKERNEQLGITDGYRSLGVKADLEGPLLPVASACHDTLANVNSMLDENIETSRETLKQARERVNALAKVADSLMNKNDSMS